MVFKFAYFVDLTKGYRPEKFQCCNMSGSSVTEELQKHNADIIMTSLHIFGILNFYITYKQSSCQVIKFLSYLNQILQRFLKDTQKTIMT